MKAIINIPKQQGSSRVSRNAAILDAVHANTARGLTNSWKLEGGSGDWSEVDAMAAARELRERLAMVCSELRERQHSTFADLEASGLFSWFTVLERRGFWRVECDCL